MNDPKSKNLIEVYRVAPILTELPLGIECIHAYGDYLLVGTKQGNLLLYKLVQKQTKELKFDVHLLRSNKAFSKKPIIQVAGVPEFHLIISLSDNVISVHDLNKVVSPLIAVLQKTKGASLFDINVQKCQTLTGDTQYTLRMCVVVKRKIMLFYWKNDNFLELAPDLTVSDTPKVVAWCSESLCLGFRNEYCLVQISGKTTELFPLGKHPEPIVTSLDPNRFAVGIDEKTFLLDQEAKPLLKYPVTWSECPIAMCYDYPYLVALMPSSVIEVRTAEPILPIQKLDDLVVFGKMKHLIKCHDRKGMLYVANNKHVYCMMARSIEEQTPHLIYAKEFELAKQMVDMRCSDTDDPGAKELREKIVSEIENLQAYDYFCKKEFEKAMQLFFKLETHPSLVIGYFPGLLPEYFCKELNYPQEPPDFKGADREAALFALADYLLEVRKKLQKLSEIDSTTLSSSGSFESNSGSQSAYRSDQSSNRVNNLPKDIQNQNSPTFHKYSKSRDKLMEIIDTTLLKCYLQTNPTLVPSLVRLPDNRCHLEETEACLKKDQKFSELIIFYQTRGLHQKALDLLSTQAKKPKSSLPGHEMTIQYLQKLGETNLHLIFEYAKWVLEEHPDDGLRIFTEDLAETESLPRESVFDYLQKVNQDLIIPYLEHIISVWGDKTARFHNILANKLREKVRSLRDEYIHSLPEGQTAAPAGQEPGELGALRQKLIKFLETSDHYSTETLSIFFSNDELWEERAIVAGKMGSHRDALMIYIHYIKDLKKAEEYCLKTYNKNTPGNRDVFLTLLKLYISDTIPSSDPGQSSTSSSRIEFKATSSVTNSKENLEEALKLLRNHATKMDPISVLLMLPANIPMSSIISYLQTVIRHLLKERHDDLILKNILISQYLFLQNDRIKLYQQHRVIVDESNVCRECFKKLGTSAFLRCPNGDLIHYSCKDRR